MIKRIRADNYKSLVGFECEFDRASMVMGENGSGKSTVVGLVQLIVALLAQDEAVESLFPVETLTRWRSDSLQTFELGVRASDGTDFRYFLEVEHDREARDCRISGERLHARAGVEYKPIFESSGGETRLYPVEGAESPRFPLNPARSAVGMIGSLDKFPMLSLFLKSVLNTFVLRLNPFSMEPESRKEVQIPHESFSNFTSWYRRVSTGQQEGVERLTHYLREVLPGFQSIRMTPEGDQVRHFRVSFDSPSGNGHARSPYVVSLTELSEGQRALIALYSLLAFGVVRDASLFIDEPDNFLALREIQPWIAQCTDAIRETGKGQLVVISHHPEIIDYLGAEQGLMFRRDETGAIRVGKPQVPPDSALRLSELEARGWL